jgi:hypothetical protein
LFVLGHSLCGAVTTAVNSYLKNHGLQFVNLIFPAVKRARAMVKHNGGDPNDPAQVIPIATNQKVLITVDRLRKHFRSQVDAGTLMEKAPADRLHKAIPVDLFPRLHALTFRVGCRRRDYGRRFDSVACAARAFVGAAGAG